MEKWRCSMFDKFHHVSVLFCWDLGHGDHLYVSTTVVSSPPFPLKAPSIPEISGGRNTLQTVETRDHYRRMDDGFRVIHVEKKYIHVLNIIIKPTVSNLTFLYIGI